MAITKSVFTRRCPHSGEISKHSEISFHRSFTIDEKKLIITIVETVKKIGPNTNRKLFLKKFHVQLFKQLDMKFEEECQLEISKSYLENQLDIVLKAMSKK